MRVAIVGCGAIGGHLAVKFGQSGAEVSVLARGKTLSAIQQNGVQLKNADGEYWRVAAHVSDVAADLGKQDVVLVSVKTTALTDIAASLPPLMGPATRVVFMLNGLPWWYLHALNGDASAWSPPISTTIATLARVVPRDQVIGGIASSANHVLEPGVVWNSNPKGGFLFGEPAGGSSALVEELASRVSHHQGYGRASPQIQDEVWRKLYSNIVTHSLGSLTGAASQDLMTDPALQSLNMRVVGEMLEVAAACGCQLAPSEFAFVMGTAGHKSSMLQDFEQRRRPEIDSLLSPLVDLARMRGLKVPTLELLLTVLRKKASILGIYP